MTRPPSRAGVDVRLAMFACVFGAAFVSQMGCWGLARRGQATGAAQPRAGASLDSVRITLERPPCLGTCPVYALELTGTGDVVFDGRAHVDSIGRFSGHVSPKRVLALVHAFEEADYFSLADRYSRGQPTCPLYAADAPTVVTSISLGGRTKRVEHDQGCQGVPARLTELELRIDRTAESWRWIGRR